MQPRLVGRLATSANILMACSWKVNNFITESAMLSPSCCYSVFVVIIPLTTKWLTKLPTNRTQPQRWCMCNSCYNNNNNKQRIEEQQHKLFMCARIYATTRFSSASKLNKAWVWVESVWKWWWIWLVVHKCDWKRINDNHWGDIVLMGKENNNFHVRDSTFIDFCLKSSFKISLSCFWVLSVNQKWVQEIQLVTYP